MRRRWSSMERGHFRGGVASQRIWQCHDGKLRRHYRRRRRGRLGANRLSARSATRVLLLEAGRDFPPGAEPADVLDSYPRSYYNDAYFWPGLKVHWRRKENSPLV